LYKGRDRTEETVAEKEHKRGGTINDALAQEISTTAVDVISIVTGTGLAPDRTRIAIGRTVANLDLSGGAATDNRIHVDGLDKPFEIEKPDDLSKRMQV